METNYTVVTLGGYLLMSIIMGAIGSDKTCGFFGAFGASLFFTPFGGLIVIATSTDKRRQKMLDKIAMHQLKQMEEEKIIKGND